MKIFLSYASEDHSLAEDICHSIQAHGHKVFFDRTQLTPGSNYEKRIKRSATSCELFVFLISPNSVSTGRFTLTELSFVKDRWPKADRRVLPVMLKETPLTDVPSYLRSVTILEPKGNIPAEVSNTVNLLATQKNSGLWRMTVAVLSIFFIASGSQKFANFSVTTGQPKLHERGLFEDPNIYTLPVEVKNVSHRPKSIYDLKVESIPPGKILSASSEMKLLAMERGKLTSGLAWSSKLKFSAKKNAKISQWRTCVFETDRSLPECGGFSKWTPPLAIKTEVVYSNLSPNNPEFQKNQATSFWPEKLREHAVAFSTPADEGYIFENAELALRLRQGNKKNRISVAIREDKNGTPGKVLEAIEVFGKMPRYPSPPRLVLVNSVKKFALSPDTRYWVTAQQEAGDESANWFHTAPFGTLGVSASRDKLTSWSVGNRTAEAVRINGSKFQENQNN